MKKIILFGMICLTLMSTGCGCDKKDKNSDQNKEEIKANTNENVIKDQQLDVFQFTNTSLIYENGNSVLETLVTNTSNETVYLEEFKIHVKDEQGNEIVTMTGFIGDSIGANSSKTIVSTYGDDLTSAASISYEVIK